MLKLIMLSSFWSGAVGGTLTGAIIAMMVVRGAGLPITVPTPATDDEGRGNIEYSSSHEKAVVEAVQAASPAVVSIVISKDVPVLEQYYEDVPNPFNDFFGSPFQFQVPRLRERGTERQEIGGGSGFLVSAEGLIITNRHVVNQEEAEYTVFLNDGSRHEAEVIARDPVVDIAVLKIEATEAPFLSFDDSDALQVGQTVIAIGNALGEFSNSVSTGVVSGLSRSIQAGDGLGQPEQLEEVIQTDAAINPGNSGGPLLDLAGNVIGVPPVTPPIMPEDRKNAYAIQERADERARDELLKEFNKEFGLSVNLKLLFQSRPCPCIVCGHHHVTSEDCPIREPTEGHAPSGLYHNEAMKLAWAEGHGMFDDC